MTPKKQENTNKSATLHILIREGIYIYIYNHNPLEKKVENTNKSAMLHVHIH